MFVGWINGHLLGPRDASPIFAGFIPRVIDSRLLQNRNRRAGEEWPYGCLASASKCPRIVGQSSLLARISYRSISCRASVVEAS